MRWSGADDLVSGMRILGDQAAFLTAADNGTLEATEDEIFRIGRAVAGSATLQSALTDPAIAASAKAGIVTDLLAGTGHRHHLPGGRLHVEPLARSAYRSGHR